MKILILTNLYPPQELGGYGRSMADFGWGLQKLGHEVEVICSDSPHLGTSSTRGPSKETIIRSLNLKGSYQGGVTQITDDIMLKHISQLNAISINKLWKEKGPFDGVLVGNIDLLGIDILDNIWQYGVPVLHHIGFINAPFKSEEQPTNDAYQLIGASKAVCKALEQGGLVKKNAEGKYEEIPVVNQAVVKN